jgi:hypothetical protein
VGDVERNASAVVLMAAGTATLAALDGANRACRSAKGTEAMKRGLEYTNTVCDESPPRIEAAR